MTYTHSNKLKRELLLHGMHCVERALWVKYYQTFMLCILYVNIAVLESQFTNVHVEYTI